MTIQAIAVLALRLTFIRLLEFWLGRKVGHGWNRGSGIGLQKMIAASWQIYNESSVRCSF